jgi:hypothetical protein
MKYNDVFSNATYDDCLIRGGIIEKKFYFSYFRVDFLVRNIQISILAGNIDISHYMGCLLLVKNFLV